MENSGRFVFYNNIYFFTKNQKQNNRYWTGIAWHVTSFSRSIALDQSAREDSLSYCKKYYLLKELSLGEGFPAVVEDVSLS